MGNTTIFSGCVSAVTIKNSGLFLITDPRVEEISTVLSENINSKVIIDGVSALTLSATHISQDDFYQRAATSTLLSNELYVVSSDCINAYGLQIKNLSAATDLSDAVTLGQLLAASSSLSNVLSNYYLKSETSSASELTSALADKLEANDVSISYDSTARKIVLASKSHTTSVDCNDFIKDGMLSSAELCGTQLVLKFNTDAGSNPISVELSNFVDDYDGKITELSNKVHEAYIIDGLNTISANLCCETNTVISLTWIVKSQYVGTYVLSTLSGYGYATYVPENPLPEDKRIELILNEGSSWDPDRLYDFGIAVSYWRVVADGDGEADHYDWVNDSGGTTGLLPENATHYEDGMWQADFPYLVKQTKKLATTDDLIAYLPAGNYLSSNALANYYQKSETSSATEINNAFELSSGNKVFIDDHILSSAGYSDLSVVKLSASEYEALVSTSTVLSNALYIVEDEFEDAYGQQVKNMAPGTDLSDAVNLEQLSNAINNILMPTDLSDFTNSPNFATLGYVNQVLGDIETILNNL